MVQLVSDGGGGPRSSVRSSLSATDRAWLQKASAATQRLKPKLGPSTTPTPFKGIPFNQYAPAKPTAPTVGRKRKTGPKFTPTVKLDASQVTDLRSQGPAGLRRGASPRRRF